MQHPPEAAAPDHKVRSWGVAAYVIILLPPPPLLSVPFATLVWACSILFNYTILRDTKVRSFLRNKGNKQ